MTLESGHVLPDPSSLIEPLQRHGNLVFMVHIELVQTDYSTKASHKTSCSWHRKSSTNINMTSVCSLRVGRALSKGTGFKCRATSKDVEWKQLTCEWHSGQIWRQVMHGGRTFLLSMVACFTQPTMSPGRKRRGALCSQQLRALPWQMHCRDAQWLLWHFKKCWSLRNTWQLIQDATTTLNLSRVAHRSLICTDKGSFATQAKQTKAKLHNKYKGLYQCD